MLIIKETLEETGRQEMADKVNKIYAEKGMRGFGEIVDRSQELSIPSVLVRFASLVATFLTVRLLRQHMESDQESMPSLTFSQNVDSFSEIESEIETEVETLEKVETDSVD